MGSVQTYCRGLAGTPCAAHWHRWPRQSTPLMVRGRPCRGSGGPPAEPSGGSTQLWSDLCEGLEEEKGVISGENAEEETRGRRKIISW